MFRPLLEPHPSVTDYDEKWQARLLSTLCLAGILLGGLSMGIGIQLQDVSEEEAATGLATILLICGAYTLARSPWPRLGLWFFIAETTAGIWALIHFAGSTPEAPFLPLLLAVPMGVSALLGPRSAALTTLVNLVVSILVLSTHNNYARYTAFVALTLLGTMFVVAAFARSRFEHALQESEAELRLLADSTREGVLMHTQGHLIAANHGAAAMLGYTAAELVGIKVPQLVHPDSWPEVQRHIAQRQAATYTVKAVRKDGSTFPIELTATSTKIRDQWIRIVTLRDLSAQQQLEADVAHARLEAAKATKARADVLAALSHELRSPMQAVQGQADLLVREAREPAVQKDLAALSRDIHHVAQLLNNVTDYVASEQGHLYLEEAPMDAAQILRDVAQETRLKAEPLGLTVHVEADEDSTWVHGDANRLRQVLDVLASNAVRFTPKGDIRFRLEHKPMELVFHVQDTGVGIPSEFVPNLFQPFMQADQSATRRHGGAGFGLALAKRIADRMGARLEVATRPGQGSTFTLHLPARPATPSRGAAQKSLRVLVAEDSIVNQKVLLAMLRTLGHETTAVENGAQAVEAAKTQSFDVILMDLHMPVMDGLEAARQIRLHSDVRILAVTADAMAGDRDKCLAAGMNGYLAKPFRLPDLRRALEAPA